MTATFTRLARTQCQIEVLARSSDDAKASQIFEGWREIPMEGEGRPEALSVTAHILE
jgi:hypothetical protein